MNWNNALYVANRIVGISAIFTLIVICTPRQPRA